MSASRLLGAIATWLCLSVLISVASAQSVERRIGLVIGNGAYQAGALATPANDAGLIAQTLEAAGFDVVGARDLDEDSLRHTVRDFVDKVTAAGPDAVAFVYFAGYGLQLEGENYLIPVDARIERDTDVPIRGLRLYDFLVRPLAALPLKARMIVLDAARANPFVRSGQPLAGGLALMDPAPGMLIAFNAAPGTIAPEGQGAYGAYAQALAEMLREPGLPVGEMFDRVRLRVNELTKGAEVPWSVAQIQTSFVFFERGPDAPPPVAAVDPAVSRARPIRALPAEDAYAAALDRDTISAYEEFLAAYPGDPMARRVRAIVAARREAIVWRRTFEADTPPAYWSYLRRYPHGPHAYDARRRLSRLSAVLEPPPSFAAFAYDEPPPPPEEVMFVDRPVLAFDDPVLAFAPPPPPPIFLLPPPPPDYVMLPPPPPPVGLFVLPAPIYRPIPFWARPPVYVAPPPPNNVIYQNIHNTVVINQAAQTVSVTTPVGRPGGGFVPQTGGAGIAPPAPGVVPQPGGPA
ncbi:MAG: caspase family protein, partial [Rhodoplanes sp.]|uniref:caspase family protein n=1 Tax=Rhodoplanes sp. TaxID=1968906 RepID=UPI0017C707CA